MSKGKEIGYSYNVVTILGLIIGNGGGLDKGARAPSVAHGLGGWMKSDLGPMFSH